MAPGDEDEYHTPKKIRSAVTTVEREGDDSEDRISDGVGQIEGQDGRRREKGKGKRGASSDSSHSPPAKRAKLVRWDKLLAADRPSQFRESSNSEDTESSEGRTLRSALSKKAVSEMFAVGNIA